MSSNFMWPNNSKLAISLVVNVEEGAEEKEKNYGGLCYWSGKSK